MEQCLIMYFKILDFTMNALVNGIHNYRDELIESRGCQCRELEFSLNNTTEIIINSIY